MTTQHILKKKLAKKVSYCNASGCSAQYFKIGKNKGIKLYYSRNESLPAVLVDYSYRNAVHEVHTLKKARKLFPFIPKVYGKVQIFKFKDGFRVGIVLQHLGKTPAHKVVWDSELLKTKYYALRESLEKKGIVHDDWHANNVMVYKGQLWPIDFQGVTIKNND